ncbi:MAG: peptide ABC transporter substrate-binding protein [Gemmatimonadetes bacterium]|nr:peptide ABC transporter substrate-binding protein [Gemmatimonadota bacterium]
MPHRSIRGALLAVALAVGACTPAPRGDVIVLASGADLEGMNPLATVHPLSRQLQRYALFVTLVRLDSSLAPAPYFARSWIWSPDRRTLTLRTFAALRWHDGVPVTAHDAAFTLEAARDPATGFPRASALAPLDSAWASDDTTLRLHYAAPQGALAPALAELPLAPRHLLDTVPRAALRRAAFARAPVGCGPFRFVRREAGIRWLFARDSTFPIALGGPARAASLAVVVIDEPTTKLAGLVSGDLDLAGIAPTMVAQAERDPSVRVLTYPVFFTQALVFNTTRPPLDDARVRLALARAINRQRLVDVALAGQGSAAASPVPPGHPFAPEAQGASVDTTAADRLLDQAGWRRGADGMRTRDGRALVLTLRFVGSGDNVAEQLVQADLRARGIAVELRGMELGAFLTEARRTDKQFDLLMTGIPGDLALSHVAAMFDGRERGGALDYAGFHTPALDARFVALRAAGSPAAQREAWGAIFDALAHDMPVAWLTHARGVQGVRRRLVGVSMDLRGELVSVANWRLEPAP